jgi:hypothetical protein
MSAAATNYTHFNIRQYFLLPINQGQTNRDGLMPHFWTQLSGGTAACARSFRKWRWWLPPTPQS